MNKYVQYQQDDGIKVAIFSFNTTAEEEALIIKNIQENGGCSPMGCVVCSARVLRGVGRFKDMSNLVVFPSGMAVELNKIMFYNDFHKSYWGW